MYSMQIDETLVKKLAHLARLGLTPDEIKQHAAELSDIIGFFEQLKEVDTDGVRPIAQITDLENVQRVDAVVDCDSDAVLSCSPNEISQDHIKVHNVF